jgi:hypothetical protein
VESRRGRSIRLALGQDGLDLARDGLRLGALVVAAPKPTRVSPPLARVAVGCLAASREHRVRGVEQVTAVAEARLRVTSAGSARVS